MVTRSGTRPPPSSTPGRFGPAPGGEDGPFSRARWKSPVRGTGCSSARSCSAPRGALPGEARPGAPAGQTRLAGCCGRLTAQVGVPHDV